MQCDDVLSFIFFDDTATTEIYTLSQHDALPIYSASASPARTMSRSGRGRGCFSAWMFAIQVPPASSTACIQRRSGRDRKSTRLNSSNANISYALLCLKKKNKIIT